MGHLNTFVVDYDLPTDSRRKRFYRRVSRYLRARWMDPTEWSTQSVVITEDRDFAFFVWRAARGVGGTSHIYEARCVDPDV